MEKLDILYDGNCIICSKEIHHYIEKDKNDYLRAIDIKSSEFDINRYPGLDSDQINIHLHGVNESQQVFTGVDTFIEIWKRLPIYKNIVPCVKSPLVKPVLEIGYNIFAKYFRNLLPKQKCKDGNCKVDFK